MISTVLWIIWGLLFLGLEALGARTGRDDAYTLTNRLRTLLRSRWGLAFRLFMLAGWLWLGFHIFIEDPLLHPGN